MQLTCPSCYARFPLDAALNDADARRAIAAVLDLPGDLGPLLIKYLGAFNPPKRAVSWSKITRLIQQLTSDIAKGKIRRHGRDWQITTAVWRSALMVVIDRKDSGKLDLPLDDHAYLYTIAVDHADKVEAQQERQRENQQRDGSREKRSGRTNAATALINSPEYQQRVNRELGLDQS